MTYNPFWLHKETEREREVGAGDYGKRQIRIEGCVSKDKDDKWTPRHVHGARSTFKSSKRRRDVQIISLVSIR